MQSNSNRGRNCCTATQRETRAAWLFLLPSLTGVVLFVLLPFAETVRRSLFDTMGTVWVGLSNYRSVIQNGAFQLAVHNTARFLGICLPILLSGSLVLALVLHSRPLRQTRAARIFKTTFLLPIAIPVASIVLLWQTLFARQGLCNGWLTCLGMQPIDFMGTGTAFWVLTGTYLWKNCGYTSILWTAGLEAIPVDQYEAPDNFSPDLDFEPAECLQGFPRGLPGVRTLSAAEHLSVAAFVQQLVFKSGPAAPCCCRRVGCAGVVGCDFGIIEMVGPLCER